MHSQYIDSAKRRPLCSAGAHFVGLGLYSRRASPEAIQETFRSSSARRSMGRCFYLYHQAKIDQYSKTPSASADGAVPMSEANPALEDSRPCAHQDE